VNYSVLLKIYRYHLIHDKGELRDSQGTTDVSEEGIQQHQHFYHNVVAVALIIYKNGDFSNMMNIMMNILNDFRR